MTFSGLPDRLGARRTILTFLIVQIASITGIVLAPNRELALLACFTAGIGYAFIYPSLGREAVSRVPAEATGRALAYYSAFFDLSMALSGLLLGLLAASRGLPVVFYAAILGSVVAFVLMLTAPVDQQVALK